VVAGSSPVEPAAGAEGRAWGTPGAPARVPTIGDGVAQKAWLCGPPAHVIGLIREFEANYPGLEQMTLHWAEGMPPKEWKEQLVWFARDVMPAFTGRGSSLRSLCRAPTGSVSHDWDPSNIVYSIWGCRPLPLLNLVDKVPSRSLLLGRDGGGNRLDEEVWGLLHFRQGAKAPNVPQKPER
jgi:hypothetical protein